jgi:hypothetical protein
LPVFDLTGPGTADSLSYETKVNIIPKTRSEVIQRYVDQSKVRMIKYDNQYIIHRFKCMPCHESTIYPRWLKKKKRHRGTKTDSSRHKRQQSSSSTDSYPIWGIVILRTILHCTSIIAPIVLWTISRIWI